MGTPARTYDFRKVDLIIGGFDISGYGEDDGIEVEWASEAGAVTWGAAAVTLPGSRVPAPHDLVGIPVEA